MKDKVLRKGVSVRNNRIAIIMPAYNEERNIMQVVKSIPQTLTVKSFKYRLIAVVVDDCSSDETAAQARKAGALVVRHIINSGAGAATRTGLHYAHMMIPDLAYAITIDADGQHSSEDIEKLLKFAIKNDAPMVVGSRLHAGNNDSMPLHRRYGNVGLSIISRVLFGIKTKDTQSGLRIFKADIIPKISDYTIDRYGFCTEMLWLAKRHNVRVMEAPISVSYSEDTLSKGQNNWGVISLIIDLIKIRVSR